MENFNNYLEIVTNFITVIGLPVAIYVYIKEQKLLRKTAEYGTFDALDNKYIELQQLCLEYPQLDIFDTPYKKSPSLSEQEEKQEEGILLIRISIFERAYLMYNQTNQQFRKEQWDGWEIDFSEWMKRKNFITVWNNHKEYFDSTFVEYFDNKKILI